MNQKINTELIPQIGRVFYGIAIAGIGLMHFLYEGFRPVILPIPAEFTANVKLIVYIVGAYILLSGLLIIAAKKVYTTSFLLGCVFLLFFLFGHLPAHLLNHPAMKANYVNTMKILALSGGAFVMARLFYKDGPASVFARVDKFTAIGSYFFAIMLILFGTGHLISPVKVSALVPKYIPFPVFWTFLSGVALTAGGLCILLKYRLKIVALLLAIMLFLWLPMLHLYYAVRFPQFQDGENIIGSLQCLAFCGIALLVSQLYTRQGRAVSVREMAH